MPENNQNTNQYGVTTNEIMDYLKDNMVTNDELGVALNKQKLEIFDHVDEKLADLKGDLVVLMRKEDRKLITLTELLLNKKILTPAEAKSVFQMEPFPRLII